LLPNLGFSLKSIDEDDEYHHLLTFKNVVDEQGNEVKSAMDDVKALFALFQLALYGNAFDKRTYMPFIHKVDDLSAEELDEQRSSDINAIPLLERRHYCYARGLAFDLLFWFFNHFRFAKPKEEYEAGYPNLLVPITAKLAQDMVAYKHKAEESDVHSTCGAPEFQQQVETALSKYDGMEDAYDNYSEGNDFDFAFNFMEFEVEEYGPSDNWHLPVTDFFDWGKTTADERYFAALENED
jgi:hypothetical protein